MTSRSSPTTGVSGLPTWGTGRGIGCLSEPLAERYDVILFTHQSGSSILDGSSSPTTPEPYRMGLGEAGLAALDDFVKKGGRVVALGSASGLFIEHWPIPVKDASEGLGSDEFLIPGSIVNLQVDVTHPLAWGMSSDTHGFFSSNPFFELGSHFPSHEVSVAVRYPNEGLRASGWLRGEEYLAGKAAAVEVRFPRGGGGSRGKSGTPGHPASASGPDPRHLQASVQRTGEPEVVTESESGGRTFPTLDP